MAALNFCLPRFQGEYQTESGERWKLVDGCSEYAISDRGRLWSWKSSRLMRPSPNSDEYLQTKLDGSNRKIHQLVAEAFVPGETATLCVVDHRDQDKQNNLPSNLRWCTRAQNNQNRQKHNPLGYTGVSKEPSGRFRVHITEGRRETGLGTYDTLLEAALVYARRAQQVHGEFLARHTAQLLEGEERRLMALEDTSRFALVK